MPETPDERTRQLLFLEKLVDEAAAKLGEHFPEVQIFVSFLDDDGNTLMFDEGRGNWHARQGMAREFIDRDLARQNAQEILKVINPPEEGDEWKTKT